MLVQVFIVFLALPRFLGLDISVLICGTIALVINSSAYIAEIIRVELMQLIKAKLKLHNAWG